MILGTSDWGGREDEGEEGGEEGGEEPDREDIEDLECCCGGEARKAESVVPGDESRHERSDGGGGERDVSDSSGDTSRESEPEEPWIIRRALFSMLAWKTESLSEKLYRLTFRTRVSPVLTCSTRCTTDSSPKPKVSMKK